MRVPRLYLLVLSIRLQCAALFSQNAKKKTPVAVFSIPESTSVVLVVIKKNVAEMAQTLLLTRRRHAVARFVLYKPVRAMLEVPLPCDGHARKVVNFRCPRACTAPPVNGCVSSSVNGHVRVGGAHLADLCVSERKSRRERVACE